MRDVPMEGDGVWLGILAKVTGLHPIVLFSRIALDQQPPTALNQQTLLTNIPS